MELVELASAVAVLLATKGGEGFAAAAGSQTWAGFARLVGLVRAKFAGDEAAANSLVLAEAAPANPARLQDLAAAINAHAARDAEFREQLVALLGEARSDPAASRVLVQVTQGGYVGKLTTFNAPIHGDVTF